jgi:hypothetical protein
MCSCGLQEDKIRDIGDEKNEILTAFSIQITVVWAGIPFSLVKKYKRFRPK